MQTDFVIDARKVAKWLEISLPELIKTLKKSYRIDIDYILKKGINPNKLDNRNNNYKLTLLTPDCFKRICMLSRSRKGETVRSYFISIEDAFIKHRKQIMDGIIKDLNEKKPIIESKSGYIYVFQSSDSVFKIGRSKDLKKRLQTYQTGRSTDIILEYIYKTDHLNEVEGCLKALLKKNQYRKYKELYQVNLDIIKNVIHDCGKLSAKFAIKPNPGSYFAFIDYNEQNTFPERNNINIKKNSR